MDQSGDIQVLIGGGCAAHLTNALESLRCAVIARSDVAECCELLTHESFDLVVIEESLMRSAARQIFSLCQRAHVPLLIVGTNLEWLSDSASGGCDWDWIAPDAPDVLLRSRVGRMLSLRRVRQRLGEQNDALRQFEEDLLNVGDATRKAAAADSIEQVLQIIVDSARDISGARYCHVQLFPGPTVIHTLDARSPEHVEAPFTGPVLLEKHQNRTADTERQLSLPLRSKHGHTLGVLTVTLPWHPTQQPARLEFFSELAGAMLETALLADTARSSHVREEFLSTLSHELRTPLTSILAWTRLLRTRRLDETAMEHGLEIIERNVRTQAQVVEDLLDVSQMVSGALQLEFQPLDLSGCVEAAIDALRPAADGKHIHLSALLDPNARMVGDPHRLQQVAWNLISNAVKFTPAGGSVNVRLERHGSTLRLTVSDTGPGIPPNLLPHIFEHFRHSAGRQWHETGGLGLGLAIVKNLVQRHAGTVSVHNGSGGGATFVVEFPVSAIVPQSDTTPRVPAAKAPLRGIRVLLVEDNADAAEMLVQLLKTFNCEVQAAKTVREALSLLDRFAPDVLISDINLPGQNGLQLIHQIRARSAEHGGSVPAIALTALCGPDERERCLDEGFQIHLSKPVEPQVLSRAIATLCGRLHEKQPTAVA